MRYSIGIDNERLPKGMSQELTPAQITALERELVRRGYNFLVDPPTIFKHMPEYERGALERRLGVPLKLTPI